MITIDKINTRAAEYRAAMAVGKTFEAGQIEQQLRLHGVVIDGDSWHHEGEKLKLPVLDYDQVASIARSQQARRPQ